MGFELDDRNAKNTIIAANIDLGGVGFDNLRFDVPSQVGESVPEPASLALIGLALAGMGAARRRKQA